MTAYLRKRNLTEIEIEQISLADDFGIAGKGEKNTHAHEGPQTQKDHKLIAVTKTWHSYQELPHWC